MPPERVLVAAPVLEQLVQGIFLAHGMRDEDAAVLTRVLVWANLRGSDSLGVSRALRYIELYQKGKVTARPEIRVERSRPALVFVDADRAPGQVALNAAMEAAIETARKTGVAWAAVRAATMTGPLGYYTSLATDAGMIGLAFDAGVPKMAYTGARGAAVSASPLSIAVPAERHPTVLLDMGTTVAALGKLAQYKNQGKELPPGLAVTKIGEPTTDPELGTVPLPLGGARGSGMSLVVELLTSVLVANPIVSTFHGATPDGWLPSHNAALLALDVAAFMPLDDFKRSVDETLDALKSLPRDGDDEIRFPGERGARTEAERRASGIPLPKKVWESLLAEAEGIGVEVPELKPA